MEYFDDEDDVLRRILTELEEDEEEPAFSPEDFWSDPSNYKQLVAQERARRAEEIYRECLDIAFLRSNT